MKNEPLMQLNDIYVNYNDFMLSLELLFKLGVITKDNMTLRHGINEKTKHKKVSKIEPYYEFDAYIMTAIYDFIKSGSLAAYKLGTLKKPKIRY